MVSGDSDLDLPGGWCPNAGQAIDPALQTQSKYANVIQKGQAAVETALLLPLVALIMMGCLDLGRLVFMNASLTSGVNEGARYATIDRNVTNIQNKTIAAAGTLPLTTANVVVTCYQGATATTKTCSTVATGDTLKVTAATTFSPFTPLIGNLVGAPFTLTRDSQRTYQ